MNALADNLNVDCLAGMGQALSLVSIYINIYISRIRENQNYSMDAFNPCQVKHG